MTVGKRGLELLIFLSMLMWTDLTPGHRGSPSVRVGVAVCHICLTIDLGGTPAPGWGTGVLLPSRAHGSLPIQSLM